MALNRVVALAGGVGGAKLALGLSRVLAPEQLTVVVNTGDDFTLYGLAISPDLDTVMYTLAGVANPQTGWGIAGDTAYMLEMLTCYGQRSWFRLGDRDLATHLLRTQWLGQGHTLTEVTRRLCLALGVEHPILPMTDSPVRTVVETEELGTLGFQEYFVLHRWQPTARAIHYRGAAGARPSPQVEAALGAADLVVICPSNPLLSIAPILAVPGIRQVMSQRPCVAVSPIVAGEAIKGPTAKLMRELGWPVTPASVAGYYGDLLTGFVVDRQDEETISEADWGCKVLVADTVMNTEQEKVRLAHEVLDWAEGFTA